MAEVVHKYITKPGEDIRRLMLPDMLKRARLKRGKTQKEMGFFLNIPYQDYQKYEYGIIFPKRDRFLDMDAVLKMPGADQIYEPPERSLRYYLDRQEYSRKKR